MLLPFKLDADKIKESTDLLIVKEGRRLGFEVKYTDSPRATRSMITALRDLKLDELTMVYPGDETFPLTSDIRASGLSKLISV